MKRLTLWLCGCVAAVTMFNSCSNDFDLVDTWQDIPIVYGLLNVNDTAQYIKVEKAFLDANTSALLIAQEPDSLYYNNISVELEEINENGAVEFAFPLNLIDANFDGYEKPEGIFADTPNYVYKTTETLNPERRYNLVVTNGDTDKTITLQEKNGQRSISLISDFTLTRPNPTAFLTLNPAEALSSNGSAPSKTASATPNFTTSSYTSTTTRWTSTIPPHAPKKPSNGSSART